jgi:hypothetical protein
MESKTAAKIVLAISILNFVFLLGELALNVLGVLLS